MHPLVAYYRCPDDMPELETSGEPSPEPGYFTFGGAVCYGRVSGLTPRAAAARRLPEATVSRARVAGRVGLPFDLAEVVANLREERYSQNGAGIVAKATGAGLARSVYYALRPMLSVNVRKHLQRIRLSDWERIPFPRWPLDTSVDTLMAASLKLAMETAGRSEVPFIWFWPDGASGAAIVTHDVESPEGLAFCDALMDMDDAAGFKSSFQLVPELWYRTTEALFDHLRARGFEGNIHDLNHDGQLFEEHGQFLARAARINSYAKQFDARGFRSACMYRQQAWFDALAVDYDMSVPNVAHMEPQRGGCCTVLPYMVGNLVELPLTTIQDYSLFHILGDYSIDLWKQQIDLILANHGLITILTHPDYLLGPDEQSVYRDLLAYLRGVCDKRHVWHALPREVARWWRERNHMTLVRRGSSWVVEGPGCERAQVAYATVDRGRVTYALTPSVAV